MSAQREELIYKLRNDQIENHLYELTNSLFNGVFKDQKLLIIHFLSGNDKTPFIIRRTEVRKNHSDNELKKFAHKIALTRLIRCFKRDSTFLHHLVDEYKIDRVGFISELKITNQKIKKNAPRIKNSKNQVLYYSRKRNKRLNYEIKLKKEANKSDAIEIKISKKTNWSVPEKIGKEIAFNKNIDFYKALEYDLYNNWDQQKQKIWKKIFDHHRNNSINLILNDNKDIKADYKNTHFFVDAIDSELSKFQLGSLYFHKLQDESIDESCAIVIPLIQNIEDHNLNQLIIITTPIIHSKNIFTELEESIGVFNRNLKLFFENQTKQEAIVNNIKNLINFSQKEYNDDLGASLTKNFFEWKPFKRNVELNTAWLLLICQKLIHKVNEGKSVEFYFLCAAYSEIEDHEDLIIHPLKETEINSLKIPTESENINKAANNYSYFFAKEHFPWFENGRYALFFDITSSNHHPIGLVSIRNNSWKKVFSDVLSNKINSIPNFNAFLFTANSKWNFSNVVKISGENNKNIKGEFLRYVNNEWQPRNTLNRKEIISYYLKTIPQLSDKEIEVIESVVSRISDNPNKGGTIVIIEKEKKLNFNSMGQPWDNSNIRIDESDTKEQEIDDLVSLVSHDGASIYSYSGKNKWEFRKLLINPTIKEESIKVLFNIFENNFSNIENKIDGDLCPFSFVGSRRWSAALTAFHDNVNTVVVISQDGDIYFWSIIKPKNATKESIINTFKEYLEMDDKKFADLPNDNKKAISDSINNIKLLEIAINGDLKIYDWLKRIYVPYTNKPPKDIHLPNIYNQDDIEEYKEFLKKSIKF
jgi:hypothetical protein